MSVEGRFTFFLKALVFLCFFSPYIKLAGRSIYLFDIMLVALAIFGSVSFNHAIRRLDLFYLLAMFCFAFFIIFLQTVFWGESPGIYLFRLFFYFSFFLLLRNLVLTADRSAVIEFVSRCIAVVSLVGIFQVVDHYGFSGSLGVAKLTSVLYPYPGELAGRGQELSNGLQLKVGSFFNATSTFDGHSILLGDFLSIAIGFLFYYRKYVALSFAVLCLILTMSRGAWLMGVISLAVFGFAGVKKNNLKTYLNLLLIAVIIIICLMSIDVIKDYFLFRVNNTLYAFGIIDEQVGRSEDPRTAVVWPRLISTLSDLGWPAYMVGAPIDFSADSGYLTILRDSGFAGLVLIASFPFYVLALRIDRKAACRILLVVSVGMIVHPVFQGIRTVLFCVLMLLIFGLPSAQRKNPE